MVTFTRDVEEVTVLSVDGRVDSMTAPALDAELVRLFSRRRTHVVVDLAGTDYMSSAGARVLVYWLQQARRAQGDLRLAGPQPRVARMLHYGAFDRVFMIVASVDEAVGSFA